MPYWFLKPVCVTHTYKFNLILGSVLQPEQTQNNVYFTCCNKAFLIRDLKIILQYSFPLKWINPFNSPPTSNCYSPIWVSDQFCTVNIKLFGLIKQTVMANTYKIIFTPCVTLVNSFPKTQIVLDLYIPTFNELLEINTVIYIFHQ